MTQPGAPNQAIWCLGMYASASTWIFNAARQIVQTSGPKRVHGAFVGGKESRVNWGGPGQVTIVKSHEISTDARVLEVALRTSKLLISVRDPRDCVVSLMQAHAFDFSRAVTLVADSAWLCRSFAKDNRAHVLIYETGFFENTATVATLAGHLGYSLPQPSIQAIYDSLRREKIEHHIGKMPKMPGILKDHVSGDFMDPTTQWHSHHAGRSGETGKWRKTLTTKQVQEIMSKLEYYFDLFPLQ